ncbi:MAG: NADH-quinone oxidoreductase subunit C [Rhodospirillales bacterium]|nr:NADH-quinone oxidoreductase subunit C [Rhodospirillales bacterium]
MIALASPAFRGHPMPRTSVTKAEWEQASKDLSHGELSLLSLWASDGAVHMALLNEESKHIGILSLENCTNTFPSVGRWHASAQRLERAIQDLFGLSPEGAEDIRPWLDHGQWGLSQPMNANGAAREVPPYSFLPVEGESLHQVPVGPVHAGIIEPGHFRFTAQGETVVRLEERLGYVHKGIDRLMQGATLSRGAELAGRISGDSTVAYSWAFAQAAESALGVTVPARAVWLRALMVEMERLANHLGDIGAVCNDAAFALMLAHCGILRERILRVADVCFGHRMMQGRIVPGGVTHDLSAEGKDQLVEVLGYVRGRFSPLVDLYENTASLKNRTFGTGFLNPKLALGFAAGGFVGRASGRNFDARRDVSYAPYDVLSFEVPVLKSGDVNARVWVRIQEVYQSLSLIEQCLGRLPTGPILTEIAPLGEAREGLGLVEGFRGDIFVWLALDAKGQISRCHLRDPSWFQWPLLEAVIENNIIADFPLCNKSFNCSYSGHDL